MKGERLFKQVSKCRRSALKIYDLSRGELLAKGVYREVSVLKFNPDYVIKFEMNPAKGMFCNVLEWRNWIDARHSPLEKWLAPIEMLNETGQILIQRRATFDGKYPSKVPWQFTDIHKGNFGWIDGKFVCIDYPFLRTGYHPKFRNVRKWR
jgi:hypothetical protein